MTEEASVDRKCGPCRFLTASRDCGYYRLQTGAATKLETAKSSLGKMRCAACLEKGRPPALPPGEVFQIARAFELLARRDGGCATGGCSACRSPRKKE